MILWSCIHYTKFIFCAGLKLLLKILTYDKSWKSCFSETKLSCTWIIYGWSVWSPYKKKKKLWSKFNVDLKHVKSWIFFYIHIHPTSILFCQTDKCLNQIWFLTCLNLNYYYKLNWQPSQRSERFIPDIHI